MPRPIAQFSKFDKTSVVEPLPRLVQLTGLLHLHVDRLLLTFEPPDCPQAYTHTARERVPHLLLKKLRLYPRDSVTERRVGRNSRGLLRVVQCAPVLDAVADWAADKRNEDAAALGRLST